MKEKNAEGGINKMVKTDPKVCDHPTVNRVLDYWDCNECGAEFKPVNPEHKTEWRR
jgi:ribosomal protein L37AE/L43A